MFFDVDLFLVDPSFLCVERKYHSEEVLAK